MKIKARLDLFKLQTALSPDIFKNLRKLLLEKWNKNKSVTSCFISFFKVYRIGTSTSSNAEKSPDTNRMLNELGLGDNIYGLNNIRQII